MTAQIDIQALKEMTTSRSDDFMLRASDVLRLIGTIAQLQAENAGCRKSAAPLTS
jgi:hypothetical protein